MAACTNKICCSVSPLHLDQAIVAKTAATVRCSFKSACCSDLAGCDNTLLLSVLLLGFIVAASPFFAAPRAIKDVRFILHSSLTCHLSLEYRWLNALKLFTERWKLCTQYQILSYSTVWVRLIPVQPLRRTNGASTALRSNKKKFFMLEIKALRYNALSPIPCGGNTDTHGVRFVKYCAVVKATAECESF